MGRAIERPANIDQTSVRIGAIAAAVERVNQALGPAPTGLCRRRQREYRASVVAATAKGRAIERPANVDQATCGVGAVAAAGERVNQGLGPAPTGSCRRRQSEYRASVVGATVMGRAIECPANIDQTSVRFGAIAAAVERVEPGSWSSSHRPL